MTKYIYNKDSFENAIEVSNYPWGFRLKTKRRTWIETNKTKGDRLCFCTLNPKTNKWCAVKKATYNAVEVLFIDENEHIKSDAIWKYGTNDQKIKPQHCNQADRDILRKWKVAGHIEGGMTGLAITKEFWDIICEIIFMGYVDIDH